MALFSRQNHSESDAGAASLDEQGPTPQRRQYTVGALLREARQGYRGDIQQIAATLRIRAEYLSAIEEAQYDRLPGPVYAQGFVRAYAMHLGLDGDEAVRRFKQESAAFDKPRDLTFPVPLAQRSIPGGSMLLAALILAICGYGVWYYLSTGDRARPERVTPVPADLTMPPAPPTPAAKTPAHDAAPMPAPAATPPSSSAAPQAPAAASQATPDQPNPASAQSPPPPAQAAPSASPADKTAPAAPAPAVTATPLPPPAADAAASAPAGNADTAPPPPPAQALADAPAASTAAKPASAGGTVYGEEPSRIALRATSDSWVQVRDKDQSLVFTRLLHAGDVYHVPDKPGLVLRTGNGSGLQVMVDGHAAPSLGGVVLHTVVLDPARLLAGSAVVD